MQRKAMVRWRTDYKHSYLRSKIGQRHLLAAIVHHLGFKLLSSRGHMSEKLDYICQASFSSDAQTFSFDFGDVNQIAKGVHCTESTSFLIRAYHKPAGSAWAWLKSFKIATFWAPWICTLWPTRFLTYLRYFFILGSIFFPAWRKSLYVWWNNSPEE